MSWSFGRAVSSWLVIISSVSFGVAEAQEYKGPVWGGSGGTSSYNLDCGASGVMVGIYGKTGAWIDQIGITCQTINSDGSLGGSYTRGPVGGPGGNGAASRCESGMVVAQMIAATGSFVDRVIVRCHPWDAAARRYTDGSGVNPGNCGTVGTVGYLGGIKLNSYVKCPIERVAKAIRGKHGSYIDSLQFVCDEYIK
jgi:hypothetical protein